MFKQTPKLRFQPVYYGRCGGFILWRPSCQPLYVNDMSEINFSMLHGAPICSHQKYVSSSYTSEDVEYLIPWWPFWMPTKVAYHLVSLLGYVGERIYAKNTFCAD